MTVRDEEVRVEGRMRGITFAKQFPNPAEPLRGLFVADQVAATAHAVAWTVVAPVPYVPRPLAGLLSRPRVPVEGVMGEVRVLRPRYAVLPRRMLYTSVAGSMARAASAGFDAVVRDARPQFVHAHALYPSAAAAMRLAGRHGLPLVVSVHGSDLYTHLERPAWHRIVADVARNADALVCVSTSLARDVVRHLGADEARVHVVPDCYDAGTFFPAPATDPGDGVLRLISVGRLVPVKGFDLLLEALARAVALGVDARLVIVGDGPEREALVRAAASLGLAGRVELAGALPGAGLAERLRASDVFVSASRREGFGVAIVEALACGIPVLATDSGGPADIVGRDDGIICPQGDTEALARGIVRMADGLDRFDRQVIARRALERFGPEAVGGRLIEVYRGVLREEAAGGAA